MNASNRLIYDFRQRTGMSLLFPSLPGYDTRRDPG